ncbi:MAG: hypothetical protein LBG17_04265 [Bacteroidales bacterium]|jgi:hypothetical protein|nr:hypothetical protein [Bacteroidales bacterium]
MKQIILLILSSALLLPACTRNAKIDIKQANEKYLAMQHRTAQGWNTLKNVIIFVILYLNNRK